MVESGWIGWDEIDKQHAALMQRAAELKACVGARDIAGASAVLAEFIEAAVRHCAAEEELMDRCQYPERAAHKNAHDLFVRDLAALSSALADSGLGEAVGEWAGVRIPEWLAFHIQTNDAPLARHLARSRSSKVPRPTST